MNFTNITSGFRAVVRHDRLLKERVHDTYQSRGKLQEPTVCPECHAVFRKGAWRWDAMPETAHHEMCPACRRIQDRYPAGFVNLSGDFFGEHQEEIMNLVHNHEAREKAERPLQRIMAIENAEDGVHITTTDMRLARAIGEALHRAYQGVLDYHYNPQTFLLRVHWAR